MLQLLATKLRCPSIPANWIPRLNLIQRLNEGLELNRQVTLVSAPAGFGKTTCTSEWVNKLVHYHVAWLSLDPADDDPTRFFSYFIAALQKLNPNIGQEINSLILSGQLPPWEIISATLINDIVALNGHFLLVLDDFHVIQDRVILQVFEQLLANFPDPLHLTLITREDPPLPLSRLRAGNLLTEIRARDLRFSHSDIDHFLNDLMGLSLTQADITTLEAKTEGWIVGLQLAALSVRDRSDRTSFIANLSGSHRFILNYLTEQILNQQSVEIQDFLLETSVLDKLNGGLCDAVSERSDSHFLLERLFKDNLFLIPLDDERIWYRYHHLFRELLRDLLKISRKTQLKVLHQRASHWFAENGMVSEAIQHAIEAGDYAMAVELLETHAMDMITQGYAKTVNGWVEALPKEWFWRSPKTNLAFAWALILHGAYAQVTPYLERLQSFFSGSVMLEEDRQSIKAEWLVMMALVDNMEGKISESFAKADQAVKIAPVEDDRVMSLAYFGQACAFQIMERYDAAEKAYRLAIKHGRLSGNLIAEMMSISGLSQLALEQGRLHLAFEIVSPAIARLEKTKSLPPISTVIFGILGMIYYQWCQTELAGHYLTLALQLSTLGGVKSGIIGCHVLLSRLSRLKGDWETAGHEIHLAIDKLHDDTPDYIRQETIAQQALVYLAQNRPEAAEIILREPGFSFEGQFSYPKPLPQRSISHSLALLFHSSLYVLIYLARNKEDLAGIPAGIELADQLVSMAIESQSLLAELEILLIRAQMYSLAGDQAHSLDDYQKALALGEQEEIIGVFVESGTPVAEALAVLEAQDQLGKVSPSYARRILEAFSASGYLKSSLSEPGVHAKKGVVSLAEPLSERELDVLRLMSTGLKYKDIADRLYISLNTVRFHVKTIYGKLNVNNRTQAIERSRRLEII